MSNNYNKSDIEIKAKRLLSPLQMACPDNVWHELSCQLNEQRSKKRAVANKFYSPRNLAFAFIALGIVAIGLWELSTRLEGKAVYRQPKMNTMPVQETYAQPEKKEVAPVNKPQPTLLAMNDSAKPVNNTPVTVAPVNTQAMAKPMVQNPKPMPVATQPVKKQANPILAPGTKINTRLANGSHPVAVNTNTAPITSNSSSPAISDSSKLQAPAHKVVHDTVMNVASPSQEDTTTNSN